MKVCRENVPMRRRGERGAQGTGSVVCGGACPAVSQAGTGARKKDASPQQYPKNVAENIPSHILRQIKKEIDDEKDTSS